MQLQKTIVIANSKIIKLTLTYLSRNDLKKYGFSLLTCSGTSLTPRKHRIAHYLVYISRGKLYQNTCKITRL